MPADPAPSILVLGVHSANGFAVTHRFRREGWFVVGCDQGTATGRNARAHITADLTDENECRRVMATAADLGNGIDCVVNCADIRIDGPIAEMGSGAWDVMMDVNAKSMYLVAAAAAPYLSTQHGTLVSLAPPPSEGGQHAVFDASRAALLALLDSLTAELRPRGVGVHVVHQVEDDRVLSADEVAERVWMLAGVDEDGHARSFAHAH